MTDHLTNIEDKKTQTDLGVFGARVYAGALQETENLITAFLVTVAFYRGMFGSSRDGEEGGEDKSQ